MADGGGEAEVEWATRHGQGWVRWAQFTVSTVVGVGIQWCEGIIRMKGSRSSTGIALALLALSLHTLGSCTSQLVTVSRYVSFHLCVLLPLP